MTIDHGHDQPNLSISREDAEEFSLSLQQIGAGWYRQIAWAFRQGIHTSLGMSRREWVQTYYKHLPRLPIEERRDAVAELSEEGMSEREIADTLGISKGTVRNDLREENDDLPNFGHPQPQETPSNQQKHVVGDEQLPNFGHPQPQANSHVEDTPETPEIDTTPTSTDESTVDTEPDTPEPPTPIDDEDTTPRVEVNEGDEWYTPLWLFNALNIQFDMDVCAPLDRTYSNVPATQHLTIEDDGLNQPWSGTVWCNPPYSKPEPWARRMIHHGDGLLLTHMPMNAGWCVDVWEACDAIRLFQAMEFVRPDGTSQRPGYWLQLTAFGDTATEALKRLQPMGEAASNRRRVASPMWRQVNE